MSHILSHNVTITSREGTIQWIKFSSLSFQRWLVWKHPKYAHIVSWRLEIVGNSTSKLWNASNVKESKGLSNKDLLIVRESNLENLFGLVYSQTYSLRNEIHQVALSCIDHIVLLLWWFGIFFVTLWGVGWVKISKSFRCCRTYSGAS